jgi:hypothetical protein
MISVFKDIRDLLINYLGFTNIGIIKEFNKYQNKFGVSEQSEKNFYWSLLNKGLLKCIEISKNKSEYYNLQRLIYYLMVKFLFIEGKRTESLLVMKDNLRIQLEGLMDLPFEFDVIISGVPNCSYCSSFKGKHLDPEIGFDNFDFDVMNCSRDGICAIRFLVMPREDEKGMPLIKKQNNKI